MVSEPGHTANLVGKRIRSRREELQWSQEKLGVAIGLEESSSRARISRYELGDHEPPLATARNIAKALGVPLAYLYCEENDIAGLLLALGRTPTKKRTAVVNAWLEYLAT